jgi:hypothetical protein
VLNLSDRSPLPMILEGTAAELWHDLGGGASLADLIDAQLRRHPGAESPDVAAGVEAFIVELARLGLVVADV